MEPHEAFRIWALEEMKFCDSNGDFLLPTKQDFQRLFKPPLSEAWLYVMKHVKSVQTVKKMKGNLTIQKHLALKKTLDGDGEENSEFRQLVMEKSRLLSELSSCQSEVNILEGEMEHTKADLASTELEYQASVQQIRDLQKKESILSVAQASAGESVDRYVEYTKRITQRSEDVITRRLNTVEKTYSKSKTDDVETQCCRDVRLTCEACSQFLKNALDGKFPDKQNLEAAKKEVSKKVEHLSNSHSAGSLVAALTANTLIAASDIRDQTVGINIAQDVTDLSFSLKPDGLEDLSNPPTVQESVRQLLRGSNVEHIMRWFKQQKLKNESWKLEVQLDSLLAEIRKLIKRDCGDNTDYQALSKQYVNSLITLAIERSVVPCLKEVLLDLEERREKAKKEREELKQKFECIQNFRLLVDKKQSIIEVLARQNSGASQRLTEQQKQVLKFISERSMSSHQTEVKSLSDNLHNSFMSEVDQFSNILLPSLLTVSLDSTTRSCVLDLSLSQSVYPAVCKKGKMYREINTALKFPPYKSVDCLLDHVINMQHEIHALQSKEQMRKCCIKKAQEVSRIDDDVNVIVGLCEDVRAHEEKQTTNLVPQLQRCISVANKYIGESEKVKQQVATWWDQPAQHLTPWVVTQGLTFDQWMLKWRSAVAQVHKKMILTPQKKK